MRIALVVLLLLSGCANYRPMVDTQGVDMSRYETDLSDCQRYAGQDNPMVQTAVGAGAGAVIGLIVSAIVGGDHGIGAGLGALGGGLSGAGHGGENQMNIIRNCMQGRGYKVLR